MKRDIEKFLVEWKNKRNRMPLLVRGARQVGKSYSINEFGRMFFKNHLEINFEQYPKYKGCFQTLDPKEILESLSLMSNSEIVPGKTLLFLDEIQECPQAITALRYFHEQLSELHVIGAGSLLEFALAKENFRMPVGRVENIFMKPLSFTEFLGALGKKKMLDAIEKLDWGKPFQEAIHQHLLTLVKKYAIIGGMPKAVAEYIDSGKLNQVQHIHAAIIQTYRDDFGKYASMIKHQYLEKIFYSVPKMVGRKFKYAHVDSSIQSRNLKEALELLEKAGTIYKIRSTSGMGLPLEANVKERHFKTGFLDIGLMQHICGIDTSDFIQEDLISVNSGAVAEQFVAQEILAYQANFKEQRLYYWMRESRNSSAEVDFLVPVKSHAIPIEVKAGKTGTLRSMHLFLEKYPAPVGARISQLSLQSGSSICSIPFYAIKMLPRLLVSRLKES